MYVLRSNITHIANKVADEGLHYYLLFAFPTGLAETPDSEKCRFAWIQTPTVIRRHTQTHIK